VPGALLPHLGAEAPLSPEAEPPIKPDRRFVVGEDPEVDAVKPKLPEGVVEERGEGFPAQPLAPVFRLADQDGELGVSVLKVEVAKRHRADELATFFELEREEDRLLVRKNPSSHALVSDIRSGRTAPG